AEARRAYERARSLYAGLGLRFEEAQCDDSLARCALNRSDFDEAIPLLRRAIDTYGRMGHPFAGEALAQLGYGLRATGHLQQAVDAHQRALALFERESNLPAQASAL